MEKLAVYRWQFDNFIEMMTAGNRTPFETVWAWANTHLEIIKIPQKGLGDIPNVYIFFGYKQDATRYRLEHNIAPKDMVIARDWGLLEGRRARPILIGQDSEWSKLNWNHEHSRKTRQMVHMLEAYYGSAT
jgi:hypothetical protein